VTSGRSWRGSAASARRETGGNGPKTDWRAPLDGVVRRRQHGGIGFRVVRDRSLIFLCALKDVLQRVAEGVDQATLMPDLLQAARSQPAES
jgi:hypothetical protein